MSGRKRVTIDESEWVKLQKQAGRLRQIQRNLPALIKEVRNQTRTDLERVASELETRQGQVEQTMQALSEQTRQLEADTNRRLREHARGMERRLRETADGIRQETQDALAEQARELRSELADQRRRGREELNRLAGQVSELMEHADRAAATARAWTVDARAMHDLIRDAMPHERYASGQLAALERRLVTAEQNATEGNAAPAIAVAQEVYHGLSELRLDIELRERERILARAAATEELAVVAALIEENAVRDVRDANGELIEGVTLDVDHWSDGELSRLRADVAGSLARVRDEAQPMPAEELRQVLDRHAPAFRQQVADIVERAGIRQLSSQLRVNVADVVVQTLDEVAGYELVDSAYAGEDQREAFFTKLGHQNGNEIVVEVGPSADDSGRFVLRVFSYDHDTTAAVELDERARALADGLRAQGLTVEDPQAEQGAPDEALRDMATIRATRPERAISRVQA